jgi:hypothetical protein
VDPVVPVVPVDQVVPVVPVDPVASRVVRLDRVVQVVSAELVRRVDPVDLVVPVAVAQGLALAHVELRRALSVGREVDPLAVANPSGRSVKSLTIWKLQRWVECVFPAATVTVSDCPVVRV